MNESITFDLQPDVAVIVKRAAAALKLRVIDGTGRSAGTFRVEVATAIDAYRLAEVMTGDPAWARVFLERA